MIQWLFEVQGSLFHFNERIGDIWKKWRSEDGKEDVGGIGWVFSIGKMAEGFDSPLGIYTDVTGRIKTNE